MGRVGVFLDMDHTLLAGNTGYLFLQFLRREGRVRFRDMVQSIWWLLQYRLNVIDMDTVSRRAFAKMRGQQEAELLERNAEWYDAMVRPLVYPQARTLVERHLARGHVPAIVTASTYYAAMGLARELGVEHVICTRLEVEDGHFTGGFVEPMCYGAGKVHWVRRFCAEQDVDLERSYGYTDSFSDLPLLEVVGRRVVVNPDFKLRRHARGQGWPVVHFSLPRIR